MAEIIHRGQSQVSANSGAIRLEQGDNRIVIYDGTIEAIVIDVEGLHFNDETDERLRLGVQPDGSYNLAITKPGYSIEEAIT